MSYRACLVFRLAVMGAFSCTAAVPVPQPPLALTRVRPALAVGDEAPHFFLPTLNPVACGHESASTRRHLGPGAASARVALVLSFGASWCVPCRKELPLLRAFEARWRSLGVAVWSISVDTDEAGAAAMLALAEENALPFPVLHDRFGIVQRRYGAAELPFLVALDGAGRVRWTRAGIAGGLEALEVAVQAIVGRRAAP